MLPLPFVPACLRGPYVIAIDFGVFNFCFLDRHLFLCLVWIWVCLFSCVVDMHVFVFLYVHFYRPGSRIWKYYLFSSQVAERQRYFLLSMRQAFPDAHYAEILSIANLQYEGPNYGSVKGSHTTYHITSLIISLPVTSHYSDCYHTTTQSYLHNSSSHITLSCLFILPAALKHSLFHTTSPITSLPHHTIVPSLPHNLPHRTIAPHDTRSTTSSPNPLLLSLATSILHTIYPNAGDSIRISAFSASLAITQGATRYCHDRCRCWCQWYQTRTTFTTADRLGKWGREGGKEGREE